jgi:hypothetical protein
MRKAFARVIALGVAVASGLPASAAAERPVYPPDAIVRGMTYAEWGGTFSIWLQEIPAPVNPVNDPLSPRNCDVQPGGRAVFVAGPGADCAIPDDAAVVFGTFAWECSTAEGQGETFVQLRQCAKENFARDFNPEAIDQRLLIDGARLQHLRRWVVTTPGEIVNLPENNIWGVEPGRTKSVTKGWLFILRPLDEGTHRIVYRVTESAFGDLKAVWKLHVLDD